MSRTRFPSLPPYTVPDADADLLDCGCLLTGPNAVPSEPNIHERTEIVLRALKKFGSKGCKEIRLIAKASGLSVGCTKTALHRLGWDVYHYHVHPDYLAKYKKRLYAEWRARDKAEAAAAEQRRRDLEEIDRRIDLQIARERPLPKVIGDIRPGDSCPCTSGELFKNCHGLFRAG